MLLKNFKLVFNWPNSRAAQDLTTADPLQRENFTMSRASKATLLVVTLASASTIYFVHKYQADEKAVHPPYYPLMTVHARGRDPRCGTTTDKTGADAGVAGTTAITEGV